MRTVIDSVRRFFEKHVSPPRESSGKLSDHSLQLATAALFLEMVHIDQKVKEDERKRVTQAVSEKFHLSDEETQALVELAEEAVRETLSYHEFTSAIRKGFTPEEKKKVIGHLWSIAYADGELDKHEEHLVRKIADLLYVPHRDFIETKLQARDASKREPES